MEGVSGGGTDFETEKCLSKFTGHLEIALPCLIDKYRQNGNLECQRAYTARSRDLGVAIPCVKSRREGFLRYYTLIKGFQKVYLSLFPLQRYPQIAYPELQNFPRRNTNGKTVWAFLR